MYGLVCPTQLSHYIARRQQLSSRIWANQPIHLFIAGRITLASKEPMYGLVCPNPTLTLQRL